MNEYRKVLDFVQPHFGGGTSQSMGQLPPELRALATQSANRMINTQNNLPYDQFLGEDQYRRVLPQDPMEQYAYGQLPNLITPSQFAMQGLATSQQLPAMFRGNGTTMGGLQDIGTSYEFMRNWAQPGAGLYSFDQLLGGGAGGPQAPQPPGGGGGQPQAPPTQGQPTDPGGSDDPVLWGGDHDGGGPVASVMSSQMSPPSEALSGWESDPRFQALSFRQAFEGDPSGAAAFLQSSGINEGMGALSAKRRAQQAERGTTDNPITQFGNEMYERGPNVEASGRINTDQGSHNASGPRLNEMLQRYGNDDARTALANRMDLSRIGAPTVVNAQGQRELAATRAQATANQAQAGFTDEARAALIARNAEEARRAQEEGRALGAGTNQWTVPQPPPNQNGQNQ